MLAAVIAGLMFAVFFILCTSYKRLKTDLACIMQIITGIKQMQTVEERESSTKKEAKSATEYQKRIRVGDIRTKGDCPER